jgi:hypothetical protein
MITTSSVDMVIVAHPVPELYGKTRQQVSYAGRAYLHVECTLSALYVFNILIKYFYLQVQAEFCAAKQRLPTCHLLATWFLRAHNNS